MIAEINTAYRPSLIAMDGITAARQIHERLCLPVIFVTAYAEEDAIQKAKLAEPFGYILKPFEDRELKTSIEMALYKHQAEKEIRRLNRLYAVLSGVNLAIARILDRDKLFQEICRVAVQAGAFQLAWMAWLLTHLLFLIGFRNRAAVLLQWTYSYFTYKRGARIVSRAAARSLLEPGAQPPSPAPGDQPVARTTVVSL